MATTTLTVQDGQSVPHRRPDRTDQDQKTGPECPGLSKIPVVGWLFGYYEEKINKTELMLLLTPRVIEHIEEADLVTAEFRQKVDSLRLSIDRGLEEKGMD